jgi:hypothetical protein
MNLETYVGNVISDLYDDPERLIIYGKILGLVTYDHSDMPLGKSLFYFHFISAIIVIIPMIIEVRR